MRIDQVLKVKTYFRILMTAVVSLLIVSLLSRSFVVRSSERLQKIFSVMSTSSSAEMRSDERNGSPTKLVIYLTKRIRNEGEFSNFFENCIATTWLSQSGLFGQFQRISFHNLYSKPISYSINSIEKPPKV